MFLDQDKTEFFDRGHFYGTHGGKFCENMIARPKLSTRLFASLFFCKNEVCMRENRYINSVML